jgi:hypothetical protein
MQGKKNGHEKGIANETMPTDARIEMMYMGWRVWISNK